MKKNVIAGLLLLGGLLSIIASLLLIFRAVYFASFTGSLFAALFGALLGAISLVLLFKSLGEAGEDAENSKPEIKLVKPIASVFISFACSLLAIHFAGLSVVEYIQWLLAGLPV